MKLRIVLVALGASLIAGCAATNEPDVPTNHPAHPAASEAPAPPMSGALSLADRHGARGAVSAAEGPHAHHGAPASQPAPADGATVYTCPHHPEVVSNSPGDCPKCGMKLRPKASTPASPESPPAAPRSDTSDDGHGGHHGGHP